MGPLRSTTSPSGSSPSPQALDRADRGDCRPRRAARAGLPSIRPTPRHRRQLSGAPGLGVGVGLVVAAGVFALVWGIALGRLDDGFGVRILDRGGGRRRHDGGRGRGGGEAVCHRRLRLLAQGRQGGGRHHGDVDEQRQLRPLGRGRRRPRSRASPSTAGPHVRVHLRRGRDLPYLCSIHNSMTGSITVGGGVASRRRDR